MTTWFSWLSSRHESISTVIRPKRKEIVLFLVKWTSIILVLGSLVFFSIYQVDLNAHIGWRDYLVPDRPSAGSLSSCFNRQMNKTTHYSLFPSIPVKEFDTCFDYARLIQPFNKSTTTSLFHTYWSTEQSSQLTQNQLATLRSFVATQPANTQLYVWTTPTDQKKLMQDPLWQSIRSNRIQWMSIDTLALQPTDQIEWMVKTHSLYQHGGVWMDLDVLLIRDLSPLLHQEWLSQSSCFEQSTGAMMHFFAGSSYVCEIEQSSKTFRGASVYQQVYRRLLEHHITPWAVLPWCFTDPSQCQSSNSLPDLFRHGVGQEEVHKMMHVFAYHWHEQWHRKPGTLFNYLIELHKKTTTCPGSVLSNVGVLILYEKGLQDQFEFKPLQMGQDNIMPWYIQLNPKGQVPTIIYEGKAIPDSLCIAQYLDQYVQPAIFDADNPQVIELIEQWRQVRVLALMSGKKTVDQDMTFLANTLAASRKQVLALADAHPDLAEAYKTRLAAHDDRADILLNHDQYLFHQQKLEALLDSTEEALTVYDGCLLPHQEQQTLADIYATAILYWLHQKLDPNILSKRPKTAAYYRQQTVKPSFIQAFCSK